MAVDSLRFPFEKKIEKPLDIVFIDPPFRLNYLKKAFSLIVEKELMTEDSFICTEVEKEKKVEEMFEGWNLIKSKIAGQSRYCLLQKK